MNMFKTLFKIFLILMLLGGAYSAQASLSLKTEKPKVLEIWGQEIHYRLVFKNDANASHDGEAFTRFQEGEKVSYVILNPILLEKEAKNLFDRFQKKENAFIASSTEEMKTLEGELFNLSPQNQNTLNPSLIRRLKKHFEVLAWQKLYQKAVHENKDLNLAKENFVKNFIESRIHTLEHHEAAHLYDSQRASAAELDSPHFRRFTEMNAFYAELRYGENPYDVIAQALTGLLDEFEQKKNIDYSTAKLLSVLHWLRGKPLHKNYSAFEKLSKIGTSDYQELAQKLFQKNRFSS